MNANEVLRIVDSLHRDKNIEKEVVFKAIESALVSAARKHFGDEADVEFIIDRETGQIAGRNEQEELDHEEVIGRIGAQTAKQVIIQKVREAERDSQILEFNEIVDDIISGTVHRNEGKVTTVTLGGIEAILPRSEQIPGETHQPNERVRALVTEVKAQGSRVKVVLSRTRPKMVQRLFESEIPEIADGVITINAISREPGYRSKVAVSSIDTKVDCVGACVGVRGNRIKTVIDELAGERIDIVRFDDDPQVMIPNALQPAEVDEVGAISNGKLSVPRGRESRLTMSFAGLVMVAVGLVAMFAIGRSLFHTSDFSEQRFNFLISSTAGVVLLLVGGFVLLIRPGNQGTTSTVATIIGTTVSAIAGVLLTALIVVVFVCAGIYAMFVNMFQTCFG